MSDEQKNIDDGKRWQVDYDCNLVWEQTSKSNTNLNELKKLFGYAERFYDILPSSFEKSDGPYYKIILKPKDNGQVSPIWMIISSVISMRILKKLMWLF